MTTFTPRTRVSWRLCRNGQSFWVKGWEIFDPNALHSITGSKGGFTSLTPKRPARFGQVHLIASGQDGRPFCVEVENVRPTRAEDKTFREFCHL